VFRVRVFDDIKTKIIPETHSLYGVKALNLQDFIKASEIMSTKGHLTEKGLNEILLLKNNMNKQRSFEL
jgi:hypothetical protein